MSGRVPAVDISRRPNGSAKSAPRRDALTREVFGWRVSSVVDARAMDESMRAEDESMRAVCEPIVSRFDCDVCWTIRVAGRTVSTRRPSGQARDGSTRVVTGTTSTRDLVKLPVRQEGESYLPK